MGQEADIQKSLTSITGIRLLLVFYNLCDWMRSTKVKGEKTIRKLIPWDISPFSDQNEAKEAEKD